MAVATITILQLVAAGRPDAAGWMPILAAAVLWGAAVFVIAWPLSTLLRRGWRPISAWLEATLFWAAPLIWLMRLLILEIGYPSEG
tara:strand:- start:315 stop:572 length:258 start_codon:yes stop_codon:yes gene_type:complete